MPYAEYPALVEDCFEFSSSFPFIFYDLTKYV